MHVVFFPTGPREKRNSEDSEYALVPRIRNCEDRTTQAHERIYRQPTRLLHTIRDSGACAHRRTATSLGRPCKKLDCQQSSQERRVGKECVSKCRSRWAL